jgi:cytochrome c oxidase subunit 3
MNEERRYRIAVWIVIGSEALLFAGLFALYASYRSEYTAAFRAGVARDDAWIGGVNTLVLITSSFAIAWAVHRERASRACLGAVLALGLTFLVLKAYEWGEHVRDGIVPGAGFHGPDREAGIRLFVTLYYGMTGLHALHVIVGLALVSWLYARARRGLALELVALYWHFVDIVWVWLWPMFYLLGSAR